MSIELRENGVLTVPQRNGVELVMQLARPWRSAFGQTRRFRNVRRMSGPPPIVLQNSQMRSAGAIIEFDTMVL